MMKGGVLLPAPRPSTLNEHHSLVGGNPQPQALNDSPAIETERLSNNDTQSLTSVESYQAIGM